MQILGFVRGVLPNKARLHMIIWWEDC